MQKGLSLRADGAVAAFLEEWTLVVVARVVMAEVVVPMTVFDAVVHVNLAEDGDLVACLLEEVGEERNVRGQRGAEMLVGEGSCGAGVHAGKRGGAGGSAECVGAEGVVEAHTFFADAIVIRGLEDGVTGEGEGVSSLSFAEEVDDVWTLLLALRGGGNSGGGEGSGDGEGALEEVAACCFGGLGDAGMKGLFLG